VEDQEGVRNLVCEVLRSSGYRVMQARNGQEALELARSHAGAIDALLTDVIMPGMTGPELAQSLAASHPRTRALFMSGYANLNERTNALLSSGAPLIEKPFAPEALTRRLREILDAPDAIRPIQANRGV
jgi:CheY-like chemotaxis protein